MEFDINGWRTLIMVLSLGLFLGLMAWTWSKGRRPAFDEAAQLPFAGDEDAPADAQRSNKQ